jgi:hypothetical protein
MLDKATLKLLHRMHLSGMAASLARQEEEGMEAPSRTASPLSWKPGGLKTKTAVNS